MKPKGKLRMFYICTNVSLQFLSVLEMNGRYKINLLLC